MATLPLRASILLAVGCAPLAGPLAPERAIEPDERIGLAESGRARLFTGPTVPRSGGELEVTFAVTAPGTAGLVGFEARVWTDADGDGEAGPGETLRVAERVDPAPAGGGVLRLSIPLAQEGPLRFRVRAELSDGVLLQRSGVLERR